MSSARNNIKSMRRILIKVGTTTVTHTDGSVALGRLGHLVEQIVHLLQEGKEVILVTSGAIGIGNLKLYQNALLSTPLRTHVSGSGLYKINHPRACAAAGQSGLMGLYEMLFLQRQVSCSQILLTDQDFLSEEKRFNLRSTINTLLSLGIVPILNENDVISTRKTPVRDENNAIFWDNDSLASLVSKELSVELMVLLSDVEGLYKKLPLEGEKPELIYTVTPKSIPSFTIGEKSRVGRGGMEAKLEAALGSLQFVKSVVIASGYHTDVMKRIMKGDRIGTLFVRDTPELTRELQEDAIENETANGIDKEDDPGMKNARQIAKSVRIAGREIGKLSDAKRRQALEGYADLVEKRSEDILRANALDLEDATRLELSKQLVARLKLTPQKISQIARSIREVARSPDPLRKTLQRREIGKGLILEKVTAGLGVLLVIFESRPDALPQIASLAIKSGNGLILKGGKEALHSNQLLFSLLEEALSVLASPQLMDPKAAVCFLTSREQLKWFYHLDSLIDLVIPRGGPSLVSDVKKSTKIPVLAHSDGICHLYVHSSADISTAIAIAIDSKTDYPSACNSCETLLLDKDLKIEDMNNILSNLKNAGVKLLGGPRAVEVFKLDKAASFKKEYGDLTLCVEIVDGVDQAIYHINEHGSGHTDSIVCLDRDVEQTFVDGVDSASVFVNASTRFADGYRFGMGAEVGISTSRIHARGPVGVDGLLTSKWILRGNSHGPHAVSLYSTDVKLYTHVDLPLQSSL